MSRSPSTLHGEQPPLDPARKPSLVALPHAGEHSTAEVGHLFGVAPLPAVCHAVERHSARARVAATMSHAAANLNRCRPYPGSAGDHVQIGAGRLYVSSMDVAISSLRAELSSWIQRVQAGEEVVVTDRGTPVARLLPVDTAPLLDQLVQRGVLSKPRRADRPAARGAARVQARGPVADLVSEQRR